MKIPFLHQPAGSRFKGQSSGGMVFPCTGRTYYTHFPFLYTLPHRTARKAVPPRLSEGAAHKKAAAPGEERGTGLPSGLCRRQDRRRAIPANRQPRRSLRKGWGGRGWFRRDRGCAATLDGEGGFGDQIGSVGSGDVRSEELAAAFFNDELEQPGRVRPWPAPCRARGTGTPKFSRRTPVAWLALRRAPHPRFPGR